MRRMICGCGLRMILVWVVHDCLLVLLLLVRLQVHCVPRAVYRCDGGVSQTGSGRRTCLLRRRRIVRTAQGRRRRGGGGGCLALVERRRGLRCVHCCSTVAAELTSGAVVAGQRRLVGLRLNACGARRAGWRQIC